MKEDSKHKKMSWRRYVDDLYTRQDAFRLLEGMDDEDSIHAFDGVSREVWNEAQLSVSDESRKAAYKKEARQLLFRIKHSRRHWFRHVAVGFSGVAVVLLIVIAGIYFFQNRTQSYPVVADVIVQSSIGERKKVILPDGSKVMLNSCATLRYPSCFYGNQRKVLLNGEAYFEVVHNAKQPFIVRTNRLDVKVLGTRFNVKSYTSDQLVSVGVESGKVQVDLPEATMRISSHEKVTFNTVTGDYSKSSNMRHSSNWLIGSLVFDHTPIRDVARELERIYGCKIIFSGTGFDNLISGEHDNTSLQSVLNSIHFVTAGKIKYRRSGNNIVLYE